LFTFEYFVSRQKKLSNLSVKEISIFNSIYEKLCLKILSLTLDKKFKKEHNRNLAVDVLNDKTLFKIFLNAIYTKLNKDKAKISHNFSVLFENLLDVKIFIKTN